MMKERIVHCAECKYWETRKEQIRLPRVRCRGLCEMPNAAYYRTHCDHDNGCEFGRRAMTDILWSALVKILGVVRDLR